MSMGMDKKWGSQETPPKETDFGLAWYCGQRMPSQLQCHKAEGSEQHSTGERTVRGKEGLSGKAEKAEEKRLHVSVPCGCPRTDEGLFEQGGVQMDLLFRMLILAATCRKGERGDRGGKAGKGLWS